jgi:hypothetical protein
MSRYSFNVDDAPPPDDKFTPIPLAWYAAEVTASEVKRTKAGDGAYFNLQWKILGPSHANRIIFDTVMVEHPNPQVVEIGQRSLASMLTAMGRRQMEYTTDLHAQPCEIKVGIESKPGYEDKNVVKAYRALGGAQPQPRSGNGGARRGGTFDGPPPSWGGDNAPPPIEEDPLPF